MQTCVYNLYKMFSVAQGQSKTNINLSRQGVIQLHRALFYLSLFITCCQLRLKCGFTGLFRFENRLLQIKITFANFIDISNG